MVTLTRRDILRSTVGMALLGLGHTARAAAPRPLAIQSADPGTNRALFWVLANGPGRMVVEVRQRGWPWSRREVGPAVGESTDYTSAMLLEDLILNHRRRPLPDGPVALERCQASGKTGLPLRMTSRVIVNGNPAREAIEELHAKMKAIGDTFKP